MRHDGRRATAPDVALEAVRPPATPRSWRWWSPSRSASLRNRRSFGTPCSTSATSWCSRPSRWSCWTSSVRRQAQPDPRAAVGWTVAITLALAAGTELLQSLEPSHDADFRDFVRDAAGMTLALLLRPAGPSPHISTVRRLTAALIAVAVLAPFLAVAGIYVQRNRAFPVVIPIERVVRGNAACYPSVMPNWFPAPARLPVRRAPSPLVRVLFQPGKYPGFYFKEPYPDWRGFQRLVFRAAMDADQSITLMLRIDDARQDERARRPLHHRARHHAGRPSHRDPSRDDPLGSARSRDGSRRAFAASACSHTSISRPQHVCLSAFRLE